MLLLIGNGPSGDTPAVAAAMQRASRVLRMNNWQPGKHTGDRCEIWGTSFNWDIHVWYEAPEVWWTGWPYGNGRVPYEEALAKARHHYDRVASKETIDRGFTGTRYWASTGVTLAFMALETGEPVALAGFDHFLTARHHYWEDKPPCDPMQFHDPEHERRIVLELGVEIIHS